MLFDEPTTRRHIFDATGAAVVKVVADTYEFAVVVSITCKSARLPASDVAVAPVGRDFS